MSIKDQTSPEEVRKRLLALSYESMNLSPVERPGQFSVRGGIVDIWLERYSSPVRLDFFGDKVAAIYLFSPVDHTPQRNLTHIDVFRYLFTQSAQVKWPKDVVGKFERLVLSNIQAGDPVVHIDHGIGRFLRIEERNLEGKSRYYLLVEYAKGEKLYVPVQQIDRLSKYIGIKGIRPQLSHLGTASWERTKEKVSADILAVAKDLLKLYASREAKRRPSYPPDSAWQAELESDFPYPLTTSQEKALAEVKSDLEEDQPMDRLLVGDVGFGKTEVALRAAFKVAQGGFQVAVMVPTTILAEQHYYTFKNRLAKFPITVAQLSRLQNKSENSRVIKGLADGTVDIVIGTHRILSADIFLRRLGFLVIDEEHRFGVLHKEKLKKLRSDLDVLSLSATPIPRTLYLALTKLRDISLVTDPPAGRVPIQNFIGPYDLTQVEQAIRREVTRGGQVFYLHNRIQSISGETDRLRQILPGVRIEYAHGQMNDYDLEKVMLGFLQKEFDVLVCTTIIGLGLDIPSVNTIIVRDSQKLGLADLYQLRGRVGRSSTEAYAYFFYSKGYTPKGDARARLEAIAEATPLGSGFNLAEKDLEIRGAGNILGVEQHGSVSLVGFELYLQLLAQAVEKIRSSSNH